MASTAVAEVLIRWRQEGQTQVAASTKSIGASMQKLGQQAKAAGQVMSVGLTAPLLLIGKQAITAASDLNEATSAVTTVFGSASQEVIDFSRTAASNLGQSQQAALSAASAMGALFKGVGLTDSQMATFSTSLLQASADLGSFFNVDPTVAMDKLRSGLVGQAEPLREFGILLTEDAVKAKGLQMGLGDAHGELSEGAKVQARYALIMEQVGSAQGDFARTSGGLANSQRILSATIADTSAQIGQVLLPYALNAVRALQSLMERFQALSPATQTAALAIGAVAAAAGPVLIVLGQVASSVGGLGPLLGALTGPLGLVVAGVAGLALAWKNNWFGIQDITQNVVDKIGPIIERMTQFFTAAKDRGLDPFRLAMRTLIVPLTELVGSGNPVVQMLTGILRNGEKLGDYFKNTLVPETQKVVAAFKDFGVAGGLDQLGVSFGNVADDVAKAWDAKIVPFLDDVKTLGQKLFDQLTESFKAINWTEVGQTLQDGIGKAAELFLDFQKWRLEKISEFGAFLIEKFRAVDWDSVGNAIQAGMQIALEKLGDLAQWITDKLATVDWASIKDSLTTKAVEFIGGLAIGAQNGLTALGQLAQWILDKLGEVNWGVITSLLQTKGQEFITGLLGGIQQKSTELMTWFNQLGPQVAGWLGEVGTWLLEKGRALLQGLLDGAVQKLIDVAQWFQNLPNAITNAVPSLLGSLKQHGVDAIEGLWTGIVQRFETLGADIQAKWDEIANSLNFWTPEPPDPGDVHPAGVGKNANTPPEAKAYGGPGGQWTWVGEAGPELVKLPLGAMVIPHGAAQTRMQAMGGMAYGGVLTAQDAAARILELKGRRGDLTPAPIVARARELEARWFGGQNITSMTTSAQLEAWYSGRDPRGDRSGAARPAVASPTRSRSGFIPWEALSAAHRKRLMTTDGPWERFSRKRFLAYQAAMAAQVDAGQSDADGGGKRGHRRRGKAFGGVVIPGMARGGVVHHRPGDGKPRDQDDVLQQILRIKARGGDQTSRQWVKRARDLESRFFKGRNVTGHGRIRAEDGSWVQPSFYMPQVQAEDGSFVSPDYYRRTPSASPVFSPTLAGSGLAGANSGMGAKEGAVMNFYGSVSFIVPDADVAAAISQDARTRNRV